MSCQIIVSNNICNLLNFYWAGKKNVILSIGYNSTFIFIVNYHIALFILIEENITELCFYNMLA